MDRWCRHLIILILLVMLVTLVAGCAGPAAPQATPRTYRIGYFGSGGNPQGAPNDLAFVEELARLGYVLDQNLTIEYRWADAKLERLPELARELTTLKLDAVLASSELSAQAMLEADADLPIVMATWDAVAAGLVAQNLHKSDRNITGVTGCSAILGPKRLQLLKEAVPGTSTVAVLLNPTERTSGSEWEMMQAASGPLGVRLVAAPVRQVEDLDAAFATLRQSSDAVYVVAGAVTQRDRQRVVNLAAQHRLPAVYGFREFVDLGGLMSYGTSIPAMFKRCASFMDRILKGAKPSELPVEQPTSFDLVINAKTAAELGITLPASLNARITEVVR